MSGEESPLLEGRLLKHGGVSWKGRHFVLTEHRLTYYMKQGDPRSRGHLNITAQAELKAVSRKPYAFQLVSDEHTLTLCAEGQADFLRWTQALDQAIAQAKAGPLSQEDSEDGEVDPDLAAAEEEEDHVHPRTEGHSLDGPDGDVIRDEWQTAVAAGQDFEIKSKYEMIKPIGHGAYGVVISAIDHEAGTKVAIKKIPDTFEDLVDAKRIVREIHLLRHFNHDNVITVVDLFMPPHQQQDFDDVYIVSDLMETDLQRVIYSKQELSPDHIQFLMYQMFCGLNYIHSAGVIHRDLKPSNILLNSNCDLKLCDFGLARGVSDTEEEQDLTEYVVTRWYRAPEIMLSCPSYDAKIDVWSIACIFAEMLAKKPIFPGSDYIHQLKLIMKLVGRPQAEELEFVTNSKARRFVLNLPEYPRVDLTDRFPDLNPDGVALLEETLRLDPNHRISVAGALAHPFFADVRDPECEGKADYVIHWDDIEKCPLTKKNLQALLLRDFDLVQKANAR
mmetsp:Transcript_30089/g.87642  ORF Transcript_30089/g.87642 Transcript_30089/m.87642 type:complete len:504 (-) Transcript_30089:117-1628(-)|eukprot:CAMPEP_0118969562 /NCGR_PEP_ID=MMETSP1173-20130426/6628_1 /TAXON_ID=1034831 /ORGANISM="Rhizochromulina marina cf, Strain CCMP1243" /LENGTH=503 /DNA_ID=CAMNT_0006918825 /DNA_START=276 /DNA_END=1787 /DNA_ORIENTATION=+